MTKFEAEDLSKMAKELMPKSSESQRELLACSLEKYPMNDALMAIGDHAQISEFISVPEIGKRIASLMQRPPKDSAESRLQSEVAAAQARQAQAEDEHRKAHQNARLTLQQFAEMPEDELELLKSRALASLTPDGAAFLQKHDARRSLVIQSLIRKVCKT